MASLQLFTTLDPQRARVLPCLTLPFAGFCQAGLFNVARGCSIPTVEIPQLTYLALWGRRPGHTLLLR